MWHVRYSFISSACYTSWKIKNIRPKNCFFVKKDDPFNLGISVRIVFGWSSFVALFLGQHPLHHIKIVLHCPLSRLRVFRPKELCLVWAWDWFEAKWLEMVAHLHSAIRIIYCAGSGFKDFLENISGQVMIFHQPAFWWNKGSQFPSYSLPVGGPGRSIYLP